MITLTAQTHTPSRRNDSEAINELYRTFGILSERDRWDVLRKLEKIGGKEKKVEKPYTLRIETTTGR